jgi:hypothetical protein
MLTRTVVLASCLSVAPAIAAAQGARPSNNAGLPAQSQTVPKDSKWNGVLVGAGLGAIVGAFIGSAAIESSAVAGFNVPLTFGVIGAGAGAAIGAGIDASLHRTLPISNPSERVRRINISPVVGRKITGVAASIRF